MKHFLFITLSLLSSFHFTVNAQCLEITGILINACDATSQEYDNEMLTFTTGSTPLDVNDIIADWPNNSFNGWCTSATATAALNATISNGCGLLLEPPGGIIPANANVLVVTSTNVSAVDNTFSGLLGTLYIIYQCPGNSQGHFVNNTGSGTRTTSLIVTGTCSQFESVTYDRQFLYTDYDPILDLDIPGERVFFDDAGVATYDTTKGCTAPVESLNNGWIFTEEICNDYGDVDLNSLLSGGTTTGGTWSGPRVTGSTYNPSSYLGLDSITYTVVGTIACPVNLDSTIVFNVVEPKTENASIEVCDSVLLDGIWYSSNATHITTIATGSSYACDSFVNYTITITPLSKDSTFIFACDSVEINGNWYNTDTIIRDTVLAGSVTTTVVDTILETSFEDSEGWTSHSSGNWTQTDSYGTWTANDIYTNNGTANSNTGSRYIGMNDVGDWIEFPPVDNPQTLYYYDRLSSSVSGTNEFTIQYFDGTNWIDIDSDICTHTNYEQVTIDLSSISALTNVQIRIFRTSDSRSGYIDDIVVEGSTTGTGSNCDSVIITNIDIAEPVIFDTIYQCTLDPNEIGFQNDTIQYSNACDSLITTTITPFIDTVFNYNTINFCDSVIFNGNTFFTDTVLNDTLVGVLGCDSAYVITNLNVAPNFTLTLNPIICQGDSFQIPGTTIYENTTGTYTSTITSLNSCDTSVTTNLTVNPILTGTTIPIQECNSNYTLPGTGQVITSNGFYNDTLISSNSCDSIQPYNITFLTADTGVINPTICNGSSFTLSDGSIVNTTDTYYSNAGTGSLTCDSFVETNLTVLSNPIFYDTIFQCTLDASNTGTINDTIRYNVGDLCDSLITSTITQLVTPNNVYTYNCTIDPALMGNDTTSTIVSSLGCDSIYNITQTNFIDTVFTNTSISVCDSAAYNGIFFSNDTIFVDSIFSSLGCDSVYNEVNIEITPNFTKTINPIICQGDSFQLPGTNQFESTANTYTSTIVVSNDCDTIVTTNLTVTPILTGTTINIQECNNTFTLPGTGTIILSDGNYNDTLNSSLNCDSIQPYNITFLTVDTGVINPTICAGENYTLSDGTIVSTTGSYITNAGIAVNTCDSFVTTNLTVFPIITSPEIIIEECANTFTIPNSGLVVSTNGIYNDTLVSSNNCDSIQPYNVTFLPNYTKTVNTTICQGDSFQLPGTNQFETIAGTYTSTIIVANDCDTTVTTNLTVENPSISMSNDAVICLGETIELSATGTPNISWSTGETTNTISVSPINDTTYYAQGVNASNCVTETDSIQIEVVYPITNVTTYSSSDNVNSGEEVQIEVYADNVQNYIWSPVNNSSSSFIDEPVQSTLYIIEMSNFPCPNVLDSVFVTVRESFIAIPTGFSPNGDGANDFFQVANYEDFEAYTMQIYNRWGELIYSETDYKAAWNGTYKGRNVEIGAYTYVIEAQHKYSNQTFNQTGNITLIR